MPTNVTGYIIRCKKVSTTKKHGEVTKILSLDRNRQWRVKPIEEAFVHTAETVREIWLKEKVNGRRPETITPANYADDNTVPTGQPEDFRGWCQENLQAESTTQ